jgi:hypothetical protein
VKRRAPHTTRNTAGRTRISLKYKCVIIIAGIIVACAAKYIVRVQQITRNTEAGRRIEQFRQQGIEAEYIRNTLHSRLEEARRPETVLSRLKSFGIDLQRPPLDHVFHFELPKGIDGLTPEQERAYHNEARQRSRKENNALLLSRQ